MSGVTIGWLVGFVLAFAIAVGGTMLFSFDAFVAFLWGASWGYSLPVIGARIGARS